jgi:uncharacterized membrane protein
MLGLWRHWGYLTSINDLGCFDQAVWRAANGLSLVNTSNFSQPIHWLGFHFQPILYLFVPFYKVLPSVNWFILAQSIALPLAAWPIFRIAYQVTKSEIAAFIWAVAFMCNPFLLNASAWDFHSVSIAVPFLALALLAVEQKRPLLLLGSCVVVISCKEHFGLAVAGLGLMYWIRHRNWLIGVSFFLAGVTFMVFIVGVIMPSLSPSGKPIMLSEGMGQLSRYGWLGGSIQEIIKNIIGDPLFVMRSVFLDMGGLKYLVLLLLPFLFFPLSAIYWLLPAGGDILANLLSANPMPRGIFSYHSVTIIPVLAVAAIHGCSKLTWLRKKFSLIEISGFVLLINLGLGYWLAPFPLPGSVNLWQAVYPNASYDKSETRVVEIVGNGSLSVQANIGAHFSQRTAIYRYPDKVGEVDFIVLKLESPTKRLQPYEKGAISTLAHHLQMPPEEYLKSAKKLLHDERYTIFLWESPWLIMGRTQQYQIEAKSVHIRIDQLRKEWMGSGIESSVITFKR